MSRAGNVGPLSAHSSVQRAVRHLCCAVPGATSRFEAALEFRFDACLYNIVTRTGTRPLFKVALAMVAKQIRARHVAKACATNLCNHSFKERQ